MRKTSYILNTTEHLLILKAHHGLSLGNAIIYLEFFGCWSFMKQSLVLCKTSETDSLSLQLTL